MPTKVQSISFNLTLNVLIVQMMSWSLKVRPVVVEWPFGGNGAGRSYAAFVKVGFCNLYLCVKVMYGSKWYVISKTYHRIDALHHG